MKFHGNGVVWDRINDKALCEFINGEFETDDKRIQDALIETGYPHDPEKPIKVKVIETEPVNGYRNYELAEKPIKKVVKK